MGAIACTSATMSAGSEEGSERRKATTVILCVLLRSERSFEKEENFLGLGVMTKQAKGSNASISGSIWAFEVQCSAKVFPVCLGCSEMDVPDIFSKRRIYQCTLSGTCSPS